MRHFYAKIIFFGALALALAACATGTSLQDSASGIPAVQRDEARLVFYRTQPLGAAVQPKISVNGTETDTCQPNKVFMVDVPPGRNRITASTENQEALNVEIGPGQTAYVECTIQFGVFIGRVDLKIVPRETGMGEVRSLAFSGLYELGS